MSSRGKTKLFPSLLPLLVVERKVVLPGASILLRIDDPKNMILEEETQSWRVESLLGKYVGLVTKESEDAELHHIGTTAYVSKVTGRSYPTPHFSLALVGKCRFKIDEVRREAPFLVAKVTQLDHLPNKTLLSGLQSQITEFRTLTDNFLHLLRLDDSTVQRVLGLILDHQLPDFLTSLVSSSFEEKLEVLDTLELEERFRLALSLLRRQVSTLKMLERGPPAKDKDGERRHLVGTFPEGFSVNRPGRRGMDEEDDELAELEEKLKTAQLPDHALKVARKELKRLRSLPPRFPEHAVSRVYLETMLELPWSCCTSDCLDLSQARACLDKDHYGLKKVKQRLLEFLAVRKLKNSLKGPILCFVGPPGVGKTSVGRSVAKTLGRKFHRITLGGISDQAEIRGHRRTYVGAIPGRILQGLRTAGVNNPVILLDEVDKLYRGVQGDPAAALLEVLDPEQNNAFVDHYLNIPFDLSQVLFIATANNSTQIPPPLLDRMEVIEIPGYTVEEKVEIGRKHLLPKQLELHGIDQHILQIPFDILTHIVNSYTAEAGVRQLERTLGTLCRSAAVKVAGDENIPYPIVMTLDHLDGVLGPPQFAHDVCERLTRPGVAVGLAWTGMGGEIMFIEASRMQGSGELVLTGQLGDVMKESAQIALNWVRASSQQYGWDCKNLDKTDLHLHFPAGAVGKDGPSAGSAIIVALVSLFTGCCMRSDTALTGEVTLRGMVLPVGCVVEKVLAAHRAGVSHVILPHKNKKDLKDISDTVKNEMKFHLVKSVEEVLASAFEGGIPSQTSNILTSKL